MPFLEIVDKVTRKWHAMEGDSSFSGMAKRDRKKSDAAEGQAGLANAFDSDFIHNSQFLLQTENRRAGFLILPVPWPLCMIEPLLNRLEIKGACWDVDFIQAHLC
jgi:hypothetical protein